MGPEIAIQDDTDEHQADQQPKAALNGDARSGSTGLSQGQEGAKQPRNRNNAGDEFGCHSERGREQPDEQRDENDNERADEAGASEQSAPGRARCR